MYYFLTSWKEKKTTFIVQASTWATYLLETTGLGLWSGGAQIRCWHPTTSPFVEPWELHRKPRSPSCLYPSMSSSFQPRDLPSWPPHFSSFQSVSHHSWSRHSAFMVEEGTDKQLCRRPVPEGACEEMAEGDLGSQMSSLS